MIVLVLIRRVSRLDGRIANLTAGGDGTSLESTLEAHIDKVYAVAREVDELEVRTAVLERVQPDAFQRLGLVRYNPFEDTGGNQSFALALLDRHGDGFVVSSLHTRTATRVYGKAITGGKADGALSDEEAEALRIALASGTGIREGLIAMRPVTSELARARPNLASCLPPPDAPSHHLPPRRGAAPGAPHEASRRPQGAGAAGPDPGVG